MDGPIFFMCNNFFASDELRIVFFNIDLLVKEYYLKSYILQVSCTLFKNSFIKCERKDRINHHTNEQSFKAIFL